jgi:hypothetical protein
MTKGTADACCEAADGDWTACLERQDSTSAFTWQGAAALISRVLFQVYCEGWRAFRRAGTGTSNLLFHVIDGQLNVGR